MINVNESDHKGLPCPSGPADLTFQFCESRAASIHAGQTIDNGVLTILGRCKAIRMGLPTLIGAFSAIDKRGLAIEFRLAPRQCPGLPVMESCLPIGRCLTTGQRRAIESILRNLLAQRRLELLTDLVPLLAGSISLVAGSISLVACAVSAICCLIAQLACLVAPLPGTVARITDTVASVRCPVTLVTDLVPLVTRAVTLVTCQVPVLPGPVPLVRHPISLVTDQISLVADLVPLVGNLVALLSGIADPIADLAGSIILVVVGNTLRLGLDPHLSGTISLLSSLLPLPVNIDAPSVSVFAPFVHEVAFVTGLGTLLARKVALILGRWCRAVNTILAHEIRLPANASPIGAAPSPTGR